MTPSEELKPQRLDAPWSLSYWEMASGVARMACRLVAAVMAVLDRVHCMESTAAADSTTAVVAAEAVDTSHCSCNTNASAKKKGTE
jgi:hypothetical protein